MKSLIVGNGEVGKGIYGVIKDVHETLIKDVEPLEIDGIEVMHICFPDHERFEDTVNDYIIQYNPKLVIIHSSITVGTTDKIGDYIVYSPVRGRHPNLTPEIKIFTKFLACREFRERELSKYYFEKCGLKVVTDDNPVNLELMKLLSNIHMGVEIAWRQEVERILTHFSASSSLYRLWEETYNQGYVEINQKHLIRPLMSPNPIGGHCILECTQILKDQFPSKILDFIQESNSLTKGETYASNPR